MTPGKQADIVRITLAVLFIAILIAATFWIMYPFLTALIWAAMVVITTWPLMLGLQKRLWGKRWIAVTIMTIALLLLLVIPLTLSIISIIDRSGEIVEWVRSLATMKLPAAPAWVGQIPVVGPKLAAQWQQLTTLGQGQLAQRMAPHARAIAMWFVAQAGSMGMMVLQFLLTVIISAVLFTTGEKAASGILHFARKLSGRYGEDAAVIAAKAVRGVALGVVLTAIIQTALAAAGYFVSGIPAAVILTAVTFVLCVAQVGPFLVYVAVIAWLYYNDQPLWGTVMIFWGLVVCTVDNIIRPVLIRKGADLPLLLIFAGVIGGLIAFGVIGLFIGPVMLAVAYSLLKEWVMMAEPAEERPAEREGKEM